VGVMRQKFVSESDFYLNHEFFIFYLDHAVLARRITGTK
jgi:hypothetical protein